MTRSRDSIGTCTRNCQQSKHSNKIRLQCYDDSLPMPNGATFFASPTSPDLFIIVAHGEDENRVARGKEVWKYRQVNTISYVMSLGVLPRLFLVGEQ